MNCCGNHNHEDHAKGSSGHGNHGNHQKTHSWMMAVCFIIPIAVIIGWFLTGGFSGSGSLLILAAVLICPLMHLFMMPAMMKKGNSHHH
jgi:membrane protein YdbS with pleckstrin-like domain